MRSLGSPSHPTAHSVFLQVRILDLRRYRGVLRHRMGAEEPWTTVQGEFLMVWANNLPCERCHTGLSVLESSGSVAGSLCQGVVWLCLCLGLRCGLVGWLVRVVRGGDGYERRAHRRAGANPPLLCSITLLLVVLLACYRKACRVQSLLD